jgi:hypothetical protein
MSQPTAQSDVTSLKQYIDSVLTRLEAIEASLTQDLEPLREEMWGLGERLRVIEGSIGEDVIASWAEYLADNWR